MDRISWSGSRAAEAEHLAALKLHPVKLKPKPQRKQKKLSKRARRKLERRQRSRPFVAPPYKEYIRSKAWRNVRRQKINQCGRRCERCRRDGPLQVHHKTYVRLGRERMSDLECLCWPCHQLMHEGLIASKEHLASIGRSSAS